MSKYTLTLTARQAAEISNACEIVARLKMGQVDMAVRELPGEQPKNYEALREIQQMIERLVPAKIERGVSIAWDLSQILGAETRRRVENADRVLRNDAGKAGGGV